MSFRMSSNVAVRTGRFSEAVDFYTNVLGFRNRSDDPDLAVEVHGLVASSGQFRATGAPGAGRAS
jgi:catechol 2,3-dioxygenase-like lactoylglutathione lyase family enzyme